MLIDTASTAIWNRNKFAVTLAVIVWGIDVVSHIQSKAFCSRLLQGLESHGNPISTVVWSTDTARVNGQFQFFGPTWLMPSVGSLCSGPWTIFLCASPDRVHHTLFHPFDNFRHRLAFDHVLWLAHPASSRWWHDWSDLPPLETGVDDSHWPSSLIFSIFLFFHKGVIWLALATATEVLPLVSLSSL